MTFRKWLKIGGTSLLIIILLGFVGDMCLLYFYHGSDYDPSVSSSVPPGYVGLFNDTAKKKMTFRFGYVSKGRNPVCIFSYERRYSVIMYKVNVPASKSIRDLMRPITTKQSHFFDSYTKENVGRLDLSFYPHQIPAIDSIVFITFYGSRISNTFKNDSIASALVKLDRYDIGFGTKGEGDIFVTRSDRRGNPIPTELIVVKSGNGLFFLFVYGETENDLLSGEMPYKLLNIAH